MNHSYKTIAYRPLPKANMSDPLVKEAHCLLLDEDADIMARAWDYPTVVKNQKELIKEFTFDQDSIAEELPDGGIVVIYNIEGKWRVGSPNSPVGDENPPGLSLPSFSYSRLVKLFLSTLHDEWDRPFENINPMLCFVFSFVCEFANNVMPIRKSQLYLMSIINLDNGKELNDKLVRSQARLLRVQTLQQKVVRTNSDLSKYLRAMRTLCPGLMLRNNLGNRVMIENPIYSCMKSAIGAGNRVRPIHIAKLLTMIRDRRDMEVITTAYPDTKHMLDLFWKTRVEIWQELLKLWKVAEPFRNNMQAFATTIQYHPLNYILFKVRDLNVDIRSEVEALKPTKLERLTREKYEKEFDSAARLLKFMRGSIDNVREEGSIPFCQEGD